MRFIQLSWITKQPDRVWVGSVSNKHNPSAKSGFCACISSRITTVIHVVSDHQINYNCFNEPFAVSPYKSLYWHVHGLIFETSISLLAGSTRYLNLNSLVKVKSVSSRAERLCSPPCSWSTVLTYPNASLFKTLWIDFPTNLVAELSPIGEPTDENPPSFIMTRFPHGLPWFESLIFAY